MLVESIKNDFREIIEVLLQLNNEQYTKPIKSLSNSTIGEHTRHIIDMYRTLLQSYKEGILNYDNRDRDLKVQSNIEYAILAIEKMSESINLENKEIVIEQYIDEECFQIKSNYFRELLYNLEHSIHHKALIKVAFIDSFKVNISDDFGVAKSTLAYRKKCAQ